MDRLIVVLSWGVSLFLTFSLGLFDGDALAEKRVAVQVVEGGNPHLPLEQIGGDGTFAAPRTPGALLLLTPFAWVEDRALVAGVTVANVTAIVAVIVMSLKMAGRSVLWVVTAPLWILTIPGQYMARGTNLAPIVGWMVVAAWYLTDREEVAGILLGVAATMRLFPLWVALALLVGGRIRTGLIAVVSFVGFNLIGLALPAVTVEGTFDTLSQNLYRWDSNLSLAAILPFPPLATALTLLTVLAAWLIFTRPDWKTGMLAAPVALLAGPVTWPMYLLTVGPFIPAVVLPVAVLWYSPVFGVRQEWAFALSLVVIVGLHTHRNRVGNSLASTRA